MSRSEQEMKDLLRSLTLAAGAPGAEDEVRALVRENLGGVGYNPEIRGVFGQQVGF